MHLRRVSILCLLIVLAAVQPAFTGDRNATRAGLDAYIEKALKDWQVPGLGLAVVKDGAVVMAKGYGVRRIGDSTPVNGETMFAIASCSKAFTAAAVAMLVEEGKLDWDDPVTKYLPELVFHDNYVTREMTVRDLLCHRSGLARHDLLWYSAATSREEILRRIRFAKPTWSFRSQFGYQNIMYLAAGQLIPRVTGQSWDDFLKQRIFSPLGMTSSNSSTLALAGAGNLSTPHVKIDGEITPVPWRNLDNAGPAGSINSNAKDMAQWLRMQLDGGQYNGTRLLKQSSIEEMRSPHTVIRLEGMGGERSYWATAYPDSNLFNYGLGWILREYEGRLIAQHGGSIDGMRSEVATIPEEKLGVAVMTNLGSTYLPQAIAYRVLDTFLGVEPRDWSKEMLEGQAEREQRREDARKKREEQRVEGTKPSLEPARYAGLFRHDLYGEITVTNDGDKLLLHYGPLMTGELKHWNYDTFQIVWKNRVVEKGLATFRLDGAGVVEELKMTVPGMDEVVAERTDSPEG